PCPPSPPDGLPPDRARGEHEAPERQADLRGRRRGNVDATILEPQVQDAQQSRDTEGTERRPRRGREDVEDLLRGALRPLDGSVHERPHIDTGECRERDPGYDGAVPADLEGMIAGDHSSSVTSNRRTASVRNTISNSASNLSQPNSSLK